MAEQKMVVISEALVHDLAAHLGTRPLQEVLGLFNRLVVETRDQISPPATPAPKTDTEVPDGPPARGEKPKKK